MSLDCWECSEPGTDDAALLGPHHELAGDGRLVAQAVQTRRELGILTADNGQGQQQQCEGWSSNLTPAARLQAKLLGGL